MVARSSETGPWRRFEALFAVNKNTIVQKNRHLLNDKLLHAADTISNTIYYKRKQKLRSTINKRLIHVYRA